MIIEEMSWRTFCRFSGIYHININKVVQLPKNNSSSSCTKALSMLLQDFCIIEGQGFKMQMITVAKPFGVL